jgi:(1->4)-alpha-D-glucan 1-alpha-D-glucosylmutase
MRPPRATYRLQFSRDFGFADAARIAPYLAQLGVSHVYASPYLRARPGSTHGYDIVAHDELNPELGDAGAFRDMVAAFERCGLKQILDFVPNHMGVGGADNPLWLNVLEWGPDSPFAGWFDIDWEPAAGYLTEKLLVPVLGEQYGAALDDGRLRLQFDTATGEFAVWAYDSHKLPINPLHYARVLGTEHPALERLGDEFTALPEWRPQVQRRATELKSELALLVSSDAGARQQLDAALLRLNGSAGTHRDELDALIRAQYWRASHFRVAGDDINYRRFFNVNDLAGLRIELPEVFEHVHRLVARLLRTGVLDGLRIDHIDGLLDPLEYLTRLRSLALQPQAASVPFYLVVEKILARGESLQRDWPVEGTTGYEFANLVLRTLTHSGGESALTRVYVEQTGETLPFGAVVRDGKLRILRDDMASELNVLARDTARVARQNSRTADFTRNLLRRAIRATIACFPVYRTYLDARGAPGPEERSLIARAIAGARHLERDVDPSVFDFLESLLTGDLVAAPRSGFSRHAALRCAMKFQQLSGPVMAKGLEDTAFYRYNRLVSHNEVGGDPSAFCASLEEFHDANARRLRTTPHAMLGTSTHDSKRGEDVRARLAVLAEMPDRWSRQVTGWRELVAAESAALDDRNLEYLLWQTLAGSWPAGTDAGELDTFRVRVRDTLIKSAREARANTSWAAPNETFETALRALVDAVFERTQLRDSLVDFATGLARAGRSNGLVQTVLKLTVPGVPDIYQGAELWDLSLVDPDNRRPVDFARRAALLAASLDAWQRDPGAAVRELAGQPESGAIKQLTIAVLLAHRREQAELYERGAYQPLPAPASFGAFERAHAAERLRVVFRLHPLASVPPFGLALPDGRWENLLTRAPLDADQDFDTVSGGLPFVVAVIRNAPRDARRE